MTRALKDLVGIERGRKDKNKDLVWSNRPVISGGRDSWQLTDYGTALDQYSDEIERLIMNHVERQVISPKIFFAGERENWSDEISDEMLMAAAELDPRSHETK